MGILTSKEFEKRKEEEGLIHSPSSRTRRMPSPEEMKLRGLAKKRRIILPIAPEKGQSKAAFYLEGEEVQLTLVDQEYVFPDNMSDAQRDRRTKELLSVGFVDESTVEKAVPQVKPLRFAHPDNAPDEFKSGKLTFKFKDLGKKRQMTVELDEFGTITTDNPGLQNKLRKDKWPEVTVPEGTEPVVEGENTTDENEPLDEPDNDEPDDESEET